MKKEVFYLIGIAAILISLALDTWVMQAIGSIRTPGLTSALHYITYIGNAIALICLIISACIWKKNKKMVFPLWATLGLAMAITYAIKYAIMRPRPYEAGFAYITTAISPSFPSAHAAATFAILPFLYILYPKLRNIWITAAILVAFSRTYLGVHYPSDILAGIAIGLLSFRAVNHAKDKKWFRSLNPLKKWTY